MKLFVYEWKKLYRQTSLIMILFLCAALNVIFINFAEHSRNSFSAKEYSAQWQDLAEMDAKSAYEFLKSKNRELEKLYFESEADLNVINIEEFCPYTGNIWKERELTEQMIQEFSMVLGYQDYIAQIQDDAENMLQVSIFQKDGKFSNRNIKKTVKDFEGMGELVPEADISRGVVMATGFLPTDFIGITMVFALCIFLILNEKQTGQIALTTPTSLGGWQTAGAKIAVLFVSSMVVFLLLYIGNYVSAQITYGFGDLSRLVQSIPEYQSSILIMSLGEYLIWFCFLKVTVYFLIGLAAFFICLRMQNWSRVLAVIFAVFGLSLAAYELIPENSAASALKYINLFYFLQTDKLAMTYKNVNLFGYPVGILPVFLVAVCLGILILAGLSLAMMQGKYVLWYGKNRIGNKKHPSGTKGTLYFFEFLKIQRKSAVVLVLLIFAVIQLYRIQNYSYFEKPDDLYFRTYMNYLSGPVDKETIAYVEEENTRYEKLMSQSNTEENSNELYDALLPYNAWQMTLQEYQRISEENQEGKNLSMVYPAGFLQLMGQNINGDMVSAFLLALILSICLSGVFSGDFEGRMDLLISTTAGGRQNTLKAKRKVSVLISAVVFILVYAADFIMYAQKIGMKEFSAPLQSISDFSECSVEMKIWQYLFLLYVVKYFGMVVMVHGIWFFSQILRDMMRTMLISMVFFAIPALLGMMGIDVAAKVTLLPLINGNTFLNLLLEGGNIVYLGILAGIGVLTIVFINTYFAWKYKD